MIQGSIIEIRHPDYMSDASNWPLWRATKESGPDFVSKYLKKFSSRETDDDFSLRSQITPVPAYAKSAMLEVRNGIYVKMHDIVREGGSNSYSQAVEGIFGGVDRSGRSMNHFIGFQVLEELLSMKRVGIMVDRAPVVRRTRADIAEPPYLYMYTAEDILSWSYDRSGRLVKVLLREVAHSEEYSLPSGFGDITRYRVMTLTDEGVLVEIYDSEGTLLSEPEILSLDLIPFVIAEISESLLKDTAQYQVALMNMESSDINYVITANFPFYVEQSQMSAREYTNQADQNPRVEVGTTKGRRYGPGMEQPAFIHPSPEPLQASIAKQEKMQQTIRHLMHLTIASLKPVRASEESKNKDQDGLRSGLAYIGLELERLEREISMIWHSYEGMDPAAIKYPESYDIESEESRLARAKEYRSLITMPSLTYRREIARSIAEIMLRNRVSPEILDEINEEIDAANVISLDPDDIRKDVETGLLDHASAAKANAYPAEIVEIAKKEHVERLEAIAIAQSSIRGVAPGAAAADRLDATRKNGRSQSRGEGEE